MISQEQEKYLVDYLKQVEVRQQELHDEFFDHIVTSYLEAKERSPLLKLSDHIRDVIQPDFGGVEGIRRIVKRKNKEINNFYRKQLFSNFKAYFRWPMILVAISLFLILLKCFEVFEFKYVLLVTISLSALTPMILGAGGVVSFYFHCRKHRLHYRTSIKNNVLLAQLLLVSWVAHLPNFLKLGSGRDISTMGDSSGFVLVLSIILTLFVILTLSYLKLIRQHFDFKLNLS